MTLDKLKQVRLIAMDVDGVLTDGSMTFGENDEVKSFNARDGLGIRLARTAGLEIVWITGNVSSVVARRARDLDISALYQGARLKTVALADAAVRWNLGREEIAYIGDDLNDIPAFGSVGVPIAVADAAAEVRDAAEIVTETPGGRGAVREVIEMVLKAQGRWEQAVELFIAMLQREQFESEAADAVT